MRKNNLLWTAILTVLMSLGLTACGNGGSGGGNDGGNSGDSSGDKGVVSVQAPLYSLSAEQAALKADNGNPDYLNISVNSETGRREETWTYSGLGKMYIFWDGARVKEVNITAKQNAYSNPPKIDPALFAQDTDKSHILSLFGSNYTLDDQSLGSLSFETWYYAARGLSVSFSGDRLVVVQTVDKA